MSGQKANTQVTIALQAAELAVAHGDGLPIALNATGSGAADWLMLLPAGNAGVITTVDGRGPYRIGDAKALASTSLQAATGRLPIDENHATDLAMPRGEPSPARAWVVELQARQDGIYGRVEWSKTGAELMSEKAYRFISPALQVDKAGNIQRILRASLVNTPNLRGMAALHSETNMDLIAQLRKILGLGEDADAEAVIAKVKAALNGGTSLQSIAVAAGLNEQATAETVLATVKSLKAAPALQSIAKALGLKDDATAEAITTAVTTLASGNTTIVALQAELATVTTKLNELQTNGAKERATVFVDGEIAKGRVGVKPLRDHYIAMHAADPARVEKEIGAMPILSSGGSIVTTPPKDGKVVLSSEQSSVAAMLGHSQADVEKTLASERTA